MDLAIFRRPRWQKIFLTLALLAAIAPLLIGLVFQEAALPYFTGTLMLITFVAFVASLVQDGSSGKSTPRSQITSEFIMLLPATHLVTGMITCIPEVPALEGVSGVSMLIFFLLFALLTHKYLYLVHEEAKSPAV